MAKWSADITGVHTVWTQHSAFTLHYRLSAPSCTPCTPCPEASGLIFKSWSFITQGCAKHSFVCFDDAQTSNESAHFASHICLAIKHRTTCCTETTKNNKGILAVTVFTNACWLSEEVFIKELYNKSKTFKMLKFFGRLIWWQPFPIQLSSTFKNNTSSSNRIVCLKLPLVQEVIIPFLSHWHPSATHTNISIKAMLSLILSDMAICVWWSATSWLPIPTQRLELHNPVWTGAQCS